MFAFLKFKELLQKLLALRRPIFAAEGNALLQGSIAQTASAGAAVSNSLAVAHDQVREGRPGPDFAHVHPQGPRRPLRRL